MAIMPGDAAQDLEAVVKEDLLAALLTQVPDADTLLILTDLPAVYTVWETQRKNHCAGRLRQIRIAFASRRDFWHRR